MSNRMLSWARLVSTLLGLLFWFSPTLAHAQSAPPVSIAFWGSADPALPGDVVMYNIVLSNPSTTTATGAFMLNGSPPQSATVNYQGGAYCAGSISPCRFGDTLQWNVPSIPAGASTLIQFSVLVDNSVAYPPPSLGTVLSASLSATVATKAVSASTSVTVGAHPMHLSVSGAPGRVAPGGLLTYTLDYGNAGTGSVATTMSVALPSGTSFVSATAGGTLSAGSVLWDLGSVAAGFSDQRQFTVKIADATGPGALLIAQAQLLNTANQQSLVRETTTNLVAANSLLAMSLSGTPDPATPGAEIAYKLVIANNSANTASGQFSLYVQVPKFANVNYQGGAYCAGAVGGCRFGDILQYTVASIAPGASSELRFGALVDNSVTYPPPPDGTVLLATATAFAFGGVTANAAVIINSTSHLNLALDAAPSRVAPGGLLTTTLSYGNSGTGNVAATMTATIPDGTTFVSATGGGTVSGGTVQWTLGAVASGFSDQRQFTVKVADGAVAGTALTVQGQLLSSANQQTLTRETTTSLVATTSLLSVSLVGSPDPAVPGAEIGYKILIANNSPNTATGSFELDVSVPRFVDVNFQGGAYCAGPVSGCRFGDVLQYTVASIAAGASTLLQFNVAVDNSVTYPPPPDGTILFADASASVFGAVSATSTILVNSTSHLNLTVSSVPSRVAPGATLTYTLNAANVGTGSVPVVLSSAVPKGTSFVSATGGGTSSAGLVEWSFASLASGAIQQRQMVVTVDADAAPGFLLVAPVQLLQPTTRRTLAREQATNLVANDALLSVAMSATPTTVAPGGTVVYTLSVNNNSANTPTGSFSLNVNVPRFVSITQQGGAYCAGGIGGCRFGDILQYTVPSIAAAGGTTLSFSAVVDNTVTSPAPASGTVLTASAFAYQFGGVQASAAVFVGSTPTLSGGETSAGGSGGGGGASASGGDTSTAGNSAAGGNSSLGGANANGGDNAGIGDLAGAGGDLLSGEAGEAGSTGGSHPAGGGNAANGGSDTSTDTAGGSGASSSGKGDSKSGGCSVSVGGQSTTTRGGWLFALLGLAYVGRMQRRRRASALLNRD